jgi:hypothetical protein
MNRARTSALWWGFLLIGGGALWLADATGFFAISPIVVAIFFALAGIGFGIDFARDAGSWWAAIPAGALLGLGALIAFVEGATAPGEWGAAMLLAGTGFGFVAVYVRIRDQWWALIPGGLLLSAAIIVAVVPIVDRGEGIAAIVLGIMVVMLVALALVPIRGRRMLWLLIPAGMLGVVGALLARDKAAVLEPFNWVSPAALLVVGLVIVLRTASGRGAGRQGP